jgi:branched-chain amino acid transport system substrate-binding protein
VPVKGKILVPGRLIALLLLVVAVALTGAACGGDDEGSGDGATAPAATGGGDGGTGGDALKVAIMTDCEGAFGFGYELDIGGAQAAMYQYAGATPVDPEKPSAGMNGGSVAGTDLEIVGYGCGDDTADTALVETRRLMEQLDADVMIGPLSGDEAVAISNYAADNPEKLFIIGTAGSQDPTLQIAPENVWRYHGDGGQWNAGLGEIVYKKLGWRTAAIIMDDYSFGWTSGAGIIADFCGVGGEITKRVFPPLNTTDYASYIQQLPSPDEVDGYFWVVGGTGTGAALQAFEQTHGPLNAEQHAGNLFFAFLGNFEAVAPRLIGAYVGGFGTAPGLQTEQALAYEAIMKKWHPELPAADGFVYNYYNAAWALIQAIEAAGGTNDVAEITANMPTELQSAYEVTDAEGSVVETGGIVELDERRQAIQDQYPLQIVEGEDGAPTTAVVGMVPNVDQTFGGLFTPDSPPPGRDQPACEDVDLPWENQIQVVEGGQVTDAILE